MIERLSFCLNCGDRFGAPERDCQNPSPGKPYVDCGRGGHMFTKGNIHLDPPGAVRKHIGFTGSRFGMTDNQHSEVAFLIAMLGGFDILITAHHGDCIGSDAEFHELARRCGALVEVHPGPANDVARQAGCWGNVRHPAKKHMRRNMDIVLASEVMIATPHGAWEQTIGGTWRTVEMARQEKKPLVIVWPNGSMTKERWI